MHSLANAVLWEVFVSTNLQRRCLQHSTLSSQYSLAQLSSFAKFSELGLIASKFSLLNYCNRANTSDGHATCDVRKLRIHFGLGQCDRDISDIGQLDVTNSTIYHGSCVLGCLRGLHLHFKRLNSKLFQSEQRLF